MFLYFFIAFLNLSEGVSSDAHEMLVRNFFSGMETGNYQLVETVLHKHFVDHSAYSSGNKDGLLQLNKMVKSDPTKAFKVSIERVIEDSDLIAVHSLKEFAGGKKVVSFDLFRIEDDQLIEHWDGSQNWEEKTANGHTQIDGPTKIEDEKITQANKAFVREFLEVTAIDGQGEKTPNYISTLSYTQHSPFTEDGLEGMYKVFEEFKTKNIGFELIRIHHLIGKGNFVVVHTEGKVGGEHAVFFDLFRVKNKKIVEHWDVIETLPVLFPHNNRAF